MSVLHGLASYRLLLASGSRPATTTLRVTAVGLYNPTAKVSLAAVNAQQTQCFHSSSRQQVQVTGVVWGSNEFRGSSKFDPTSDRGMRLRDIFKEARKIDPQEVESSESEESDHEEFHDESPQPLESTEGLKPGKPLDLKNVLVVSKVTRFETELERNSSMSEVELAEELRARGSNLYRLRYRYDVHKRNLDKLTGALRHKRIHYRVVRASKYTEADLEGVDCVFSAGGDGTFLAAASLVKDPKLPLVGVNTDPHRSQGFLCVHRSVSGGRTKYHEILDMLNSGRFHFKTRQRIRVTLIDGDSSPFEVPVKALNDIFIAEMDPSKSSYYELTVDGNESDKQKSSGIVVSTGTGSTAWLYNVARIEPDDVQRVLRLAGADDGIQNVDRVTRAFNQDIIFEAHEPLMQYCVREPVSNGIFTVGSHRGFAREIKIRSRSWEAVLVVDGNINYKFNDGRMAVLQALPEDALTGVSFQGYRL
eukprot:Clim_evm104s11 gene=Clim_evmTU104s11